MLVRIWISGGWATAIPSLEGGGLVSYIYEERIIKYRMAAKPKLLLNVCITHRLA